VTVKGVGFSDDSGFRVEALGLLKGCRVKGFDLLNCKTAALLGRFCAGIEQQIIVCARQLHACLPHILQNVCVCVCTI